MKELIFLLFLLFLVGCNTIDVNSLEGVEKYPYVFLEKNTFNSKIVVDDFASDDELIIVQNFVEDLDKKYTLKPYTLIQYKHLEGLYNENTMFIGTCNVVPHNKFVNLFMDCLSMEKDISMIRLVEKKNVTIVSIVGYDIKDTKEALNVLLNHEDYNLSGRELQVRNDENGEVFVRITG